MVLVRSGGKDWIAGAFFGAGLLAGLVVVADLRRRSDLAPPGQEALLAAGWPPDRNVDVRRPLKAMKRAGHPASPAIETFLAGFDGQDARYESTDGTVDEFRIDANRMLTGHPSVEIMNWAVAYGRQIGESLVPVGYAHHETVMLLLPADGRVSAGSKDGATPLAANSQDLPSRLLAGAAI
ncbi:MAG: hypothetical protein GY713_22215 [Actinomycetia bacterium]|nr:hypothetical protein [Actinomycetes bacterium]